MTEKQIAAILKTGFLFGYFSKDSIQSWARFKAENNSDPAFFDLAFSDRTTETEMLNFFISN